uniref:G_PROTEIN_RECEP_F1_2 domain-containing protein n=1 Tax=Steinernema glaseri TaxID=37863 RepID=A0A1I8AIV0_9BILA
MLMFGGGYLNASTFVYGSELRGRGYTTREDMIIGTLIFVLATAAVFLDFVNLYFIKTLEIFHNAFGWFWASRTVGEIMANIFHAGYNAPVTLLQPQGIPIAAGLMSYVLAYIFATGSCFMHSVVSLNRCIAVFSPVKYKQIFTTKRCILTIVIMWIMVVLSAPLLLVFPCNAIGYSPRQYEYIFVKCSPDLWRDFSIVGTVFNCACFLLCSCTVLTDMATLGRIVYIRKVLKYGSKDKNLRRDIRFFAQTSVQNITMIIATATIVLANNRSHEGSKVLQVLGFNTLLLTHVNNALSLIFFNPEVRRRIFSSKSVLMAPSSVAPTGRVFLRSASDVYIRD